MDHSYLVGLVNVKLHLIAIQGIERKSPTILDRQQIQPRIEKAGFHSIQKRISKLYIQNFK